MVRDIPTSFGGAMRRFLIALGIALTIMTLFYVYAYYVNKTDPYSIPLDKIERT